MPLSILQAQSDTGICFQTLQQEYSGELPPLQLVSDIRPAWASCGRGYGALGFEDVEGLLAAVKVTH